jgi:thioredoxin reductase (NADPH)
MEDLIILGSGPAGMTAAIYANRYNLQLTLIGDIPGGMMTYPESITNFPSYSAINGLDLIDNFKNHLTSLDIKPIETEVSRIIKHEDHFEVFTKNDKVLEGKNLLISLGTSKRKLNIPGEEKFIGKGVHYCATCDAVFYTGKTVAVVGGSDSATMAVELLAEKSAMVYLIVRGTEVKGSQERVLRLKEKSNVTIILENEIAEIIGDKMIEKVILKNEFNGFKELILNGIFVEIGGVPNSVLLKDLEVNTDEKGYIIVDQNQKTNIEHIYAAGDITNTHLGFKQIITACSEGAIAAYNIFQNIKNK